MCVALKSLLNRSLREAIASLNLPSPEVVPLTQSRQNISYRCAIALQLAPRERTLDLARSIADRLSPFLFDNHSDRHVTPTVSSPGWIDIELTPQGLAVWLHHLRKTPISGPDFAILPVSRDPEIVFEVRYAYARCCALHRLARRIGFPIGDRPFPPPIAVRPLVVQTIATLDRLESSQSVNPQRLAGQLAGDFERFYRQTPLFGDLKMVNPDTLRGILPVILATQKLLEVLLEKGLGVVASEFL